MYYAIFDQQTKEYRASGFNCTSKKECVEEGIDFLLQGDDYKDHYTDKPTIKNMENALANDELIVEKSKTKF